MNKLLVMSSWFMVFFVTIFLLPTTNYQLPTVSAADSTPSADIRVKLEELKKEIASKAAKIKLEVDKKLKDKSFIGRVKSITSTNLNLSTKNGLKVVNITQDTQYSQKSQKSIVQEDYIAALGDVDDTGVLIAKKIILLPTLTTQSKKFLWGQIISIADKLVTIKDRNSKNIAISLPNQDVKKLDFVILTGSFGKNDIFEAEFVYVIPQGRIIKPKKIATASAKIATPSAKPTSAFAKPTSH